MAEPAAVDLNSKRPATRNKLILSGRIESIRKLPDFITHQVKLPADDEFTYPQTVEVRASRKLGEKGEEITCPVCIRGSRRMFKYKDRETGELLDGEDYRAHFLVLGE